MDKDQLKILEHIFGAEIAGLEVWQKRHPGHKQKTAIEALQASGHIHWHEFILPGRLPVRISGWALTPKGHLEYCQSCA